MCSRFSAEACPVFQALPWSRQHQQDRHFSALFRLSLSSCCTFLHPPSISHSLAGAILSLFSLFLLGYNGSRVIYFFRGMTRPMSWLDEVHCSSPQFLVVSFRLFSRSGGEISRLNSSTRRSPQYSLRKACFLLLCPLSSFETLLKLLPF